MLLSMTGFGEAHYQRDALAVWVEIRTINSRFLKLAVRVNEGYGSLEPKIEAIVRRKIRRGTIQVSVRIQRSHSPDDFAINLDLLQRYRRQLETLPQQGHPSEAVPLGALLALPGVVAEAPAARRDASADWPVISQTVEAALDSLARMRADEGNAMAADLRANSRMAAECLAEVERRAPLVVENSRARLHERVQKALAEFELVLDPAALLKEVSLLTERGDIAEEIVRLRSHLQQFETVMDSPDSSGRKLEFITQEMLREANTIGSKANDTEIARQVIEIKTAIERMREMIQNIE